MITPATANLTCAITSGWDDCNAILVAVDADAHKNAKRIPAMIHLYSCLILFALLCLRKNIGIFEKLRFRLFRQFEIKRFLFFGKINNTDNAGNY